MLNGYWNNCPAAAAKSSRSAGRSSRSSAFGHRAEGVLAVAEMPARTLDGLALPENPLVAVLEGVEKPGNVGAVLAAPTAPGSSAVDRG